MEGGCDEDTGVTAADGRNGADGGGSGGGISGGISSSEDVAGDA